MTRIDHGLHTAYQWAKEKSPEHSVPRRVAEAVDSAMHEVTQSIRQAGLKVNGMDACMAIELQLFAVTYEENGGNISALVETCAALETVYSELVNG